MDAKPELPDRGGLEKMLKRIEDLKDEVIDCWAARTRSSISHAQKLSLPILTDTLPVLYDSILKVLFTESITTPLEATSNTFATEHGNERARLTDYDLRDIITEYQIFRWAFKYTLSQHNIRLSHEHEITLDGIIDSSIKEAASGFVFAQTVFRERFAAALMHDLRNPLSNCMMATQLILETKDPAHKDLLANRIQTALGRMKP